MRRRFLSSFPVPGKLSFYGSKFSDCQNDESHVITLRVWNGSKNNSCMWWWDWDVVWKGQQWCWSWWLRKEYHLCLWRNLVLCWADFYLQRTCNVNRKGWQERQSILGANYWKSKGLLLILKPCLQTRSLLWWMLQQQRASVQHGVIISGAWMVHGIKGAVGH